MDDWSGVSLRDLVNTHMYKDDNDESQVSHAKPERNVYVQTSRKEVVII